MKFSHYQERIFSELISTNKHIAIKATAGAGKTFCLVEASKLIPHGKRGLFVAFNKHIVNELKERIGNSFECSTMHSLGFGAIAKHYPGTVTLKETKQIDFILPLLEREKNNRKKWSTIYEVDRVMKLARATMTLPRKEEIEKFLENYAIDLEEDQISILIRAMNNFYRKNEEADYNLQVDFQDMISIPALNKEVRLPQYDYLMVDECLPYETKVITDYGSIPIGEIVERVLGGEKLRAFSFNEQTKTFRFNNITNGFIKGDKPVCEIVLGGKFKLKCTSNHRLLTTEKNAWWSADKLKVGQFLISNYSEQPYHKVLNEDQQQIVIGSIMGDGCYRREGKSCKLGRVSFIHGEPQKDYCEWKAKVFNCNVDRMEKNGFVQKPAYRFRTQQFYNDIDFTDKSNLINRVDARSLAISYMDDGTLGHGNIMKLYSFAKSKDLTEKLRSKLVSKFKIHSKVTEAKSSSTNKSYYFLTFSVEATKRFHKLVAKYIHPCLGYKIIDKYKKFIGVYKWNCEYPVYGVIEITKIIKDKEIKTVFDIEVENDHNFVIECNGGKERRGVIVHNCQDMSAADQVFLNRLVKPITGRKILVGDKNQSIYGFRGSDMHSFDNFANQPNTITLPLSISYRCGKKIVEEAKKIYPEIEENPEGKEGIVRKGKLEEARDGDFVLCRNTRPLVDAFMQLVKMGKKAYIVGKEMEKGLMALLVNCPDTENKEDIEAYFLELLNKKVRSIEQKSTKKLVNPKNHPQYAVLLEKIEILRMLFEQFNNLSEVETFIETVFDDEERDEIRLMTVHKSKGMECERVFFIEKYEGKKLIPSDYAVTEDQKTQEKNLLFVALTRSKEELVYLSL